MLSEDQRREIDLRIMKVTRTFLEHPVSIKEISEITGVSSSTVQRDLKSTRIIELFGEDVYDEIQALIDNNKIESRKKGGVVSTRNNVPLRDSIGRFNGNKKR